MTDREAFEAACGGAFDDNLDRWDALTASYNNGWVDAMYRGWLLHAAHVAPLIKECEQPPAGERETALTRAAERVVTRANEWRSYLGSPDAGRFEHYLVQAVEEWREARAREEGSK